MSKLPSFQFYPGDWLKDASLQRCTLAAQGAWMKTLCFMFECDRRGVLRTNGKPWSKQELARVLGCKVAIIEELILANVMRVSARTGTLWSKRMVMDEKFRQMRARYGAKGGANHASKPQANTQAKGKQTTKQTPKQSAPPSSSSSSSNINNIPGVPGLPVEETTPPDVPPTSTVTKSPPSPVVSSAPRPPNPLWDCVVALWFANGPISEAHRSRIGKVCRELRELQASPVEIKARLERCRRKWGPKVESSPEALIKHWHSFGTKQAAPPSGVSDAEILRRREAEERLRANADPDGVKGLKNLVRAKAITAPQPTNLASMAATVAAGVTT